MTSAEQTYLQLIEFARETKLLTSINALLDWDQQTMLPPAGASYRAKQSSYLAGMIHERNTDPRLGEWLEDLSRSELAGDEHSPSGATIRELKYQFDKKSKLPVELVKRQAKAFSVAHNVWVEARKSNDFAAFAPHLKEIVALKRQEAEAIGGGECWYDALLDDYEPGATAKQMKRLFGSLKEDLVPLIAEVTASQNQVDASILRAHYPRFAQEAFVREASRAIGFDYQRGRLDVAAHPFCTEIGPHDCRLTTRFDESFFNSAFFGTLHEAGHGMYEQGLPAEHYGIAPGTFCSLGVHESQSRLWENLVGRSPGFWDHFYARAQRQFSGALAGVSQASFYAAVNQVSPSLIRVEADAATYDLHIIIRFELEQALLDGELSVDDLPAAWNDKYDGYLGVRPHDDAHGVLQDVHWSAGLIGYFPTYTLGNIYASQIFVAAEQALGELRSRFAQGEFQPLLQWLRDHIHQYGHRWRAHHLIERVTQQSIDHRPLVKHLRDKLTPIYRL